MSRPLRDEYGQKCWDDGYNEAMSQLSQTSVAYNFLNDEKHKAYQQGRKDAETWHLVKFHEITDEERAREEYPNEWVYYHCLDCTMPEDNEQILIVTQYKGRYDVEADVNYSDDGYYLESGTDWEDVIAWREMPTFDAEQLKGEKE